MNESKFTCNVCGESEFTTKEGFYYCNECGTQSKRRDIVFETEEIPSTLYQSKIKIQTLKTEKRMLKKKKKNPYNPNVQPILKNGSIQIRNMIYERDLQ